MTARFQQLLHWLEACPPLAQAQYEQPVPASNDASFRRYYRLNAMLSDQTVSYIIMDAPPQHEDCEPFVRIAGALQQMGLTVPTVLAQDLSQGFLLLKDLGDETYLSQLSDESADRLYGDALDALIQMQTQSRVVTTSVPAYNADLLLAEMALFPDWLLATYLETPVERQNAQAWQNLTHLLTQSALRQPQTFVHRDYHSRNLMVLSEGNPGILDFQDAVKGPMTYDAVSLLRDCYISWPSEQVKDWQRQYFLQSVQVGLLAKDEWSGFVKAMDLMGIQRHLKAAGIFARLALRDGKDGYLQDIPKTLGYLISIAALYPETQFLAGLVEDQVLPNVTARLVEAEKVSL
ncbi:aminoglycoside phosphotransferase [Hydrogenovibrio sp. SC-1]|uniref:aminoglycoside phosphotransferase family protein n=1 Tax=Hydrogenovibrio sp. SC-1 TaxID=2065820 RepID=UPI000C79EC97|nr:phosphotransferase [Hydrogenovibrio sp. SC-1]PLA75419.1 aminoglycoside phosphotransferase [Hydrogenovibrio sp. SC-1]